MTKQELIDRIYRTKGLPPDLTKKTVTQIVEAVFKELGDYFVKTRLTRNRTPRFSYPGFGTFTKRKRQPRVGRNPRTGEKIEIPTSVTVSFAPGQDLKDLLNRK